MGQKDELRWPTPDMNSQVPNGERNRNVTDTHWTVMFMAAGMEMYLILTGMSRIDKEQ